MISIIAAIGKNRELGKDNKLLWHIPEDLKRFKQITRDHAVIMGRKTFESIGRPLPNRTNIIVTRSRHSGERIATPESDSNNTITRSWTSQDDNIIICHSLEEAIAEATSLRGAKRRGNPNEIASLPLAMTEDEIFIIGGGQIYDQAIKLADKLYLTIVEGEYKADTFFPDYSDFKKIISQEKGGSGGYKYTYLELER